MAQVFPPGAAPKVPRSSHSVVPAHIHNTCKLSHLLMPFAKPLREQVRQPGAQTSPASTTPHPAPHRLYTKWKDSHCLCLPKASSSEGKHSSCSRARQPGPKGGGVGDAHHLCREGSPPAGAAGPSCYTHLQHRHPFGLLGATRCPSSKRRPHPSVPKQPVSAAAVNLCCWKGLGNRGLENTTTVPGTGAGMATNTMLAFPAAALPGVTNHSLVLRCQPRSRELVPTPQTASTSRRLTGRGSPHHALCWACPSLEQLVLHMCLNFISK